MLHAQGDAEDQPAGHSQSLITSTLAVMSIMTAFSRFMKLAGQG